MRGSAIYRNVYERIRQNAVLHIQLNTDGLVLYKWGAVGTGDQARAADATGAVDAA
jgi:hypothetical protein